MNHKFFLGFIPIFTLFVSCKDEVLPKPQAQLRLEYPEAKLGILETNQFTFQYNQMARVKDQTAESLTLDYPNMKGTIFINYKKVDDNLEKLLVDAQKFSYEHVVKADAIDTKVFQNEEDRVYGQFFSVSGDAASQAQFYATDSTDHFVTGSLYFYAKPNYDSIYPAAVYLQNDILTIMETLKWK
ncbi:gliding motility lipoprotein GldD [Flavobacteriaceae bacterium TP-CH-4]|uniref:Gliding motility lipoprotein GldD n=1 Tax=Pelagihabitans pacificus TaxID=2696054 RepID=A0A967AQY6_9FLAO|nr:gliding motility lipoprotein GldD [Pelagihabitans pacificus]NHF58754.1 gliding motility lipoprotein GldD [Pelagihabitans pacificus]